MTNLKTPVVIINFKAYHEIEGDKSLKLARICEQVSEESGVSIAVCPPITELGVVARNVNIPVLSQNTDAYAPGSATGWVTASMVKSTGAVGTLINHSEHKFHNNVIGECIGLCKADGLVTLVCAESVKKAVEVAAFAPDFIAIEPQGLIGGNVSVTTANPYIIEDTVTSLKEVNKKISVLCGAGIKTKNDLTKALELGADGILIASAIVKSKDPRATLLSLVSSI